MTPKPVNELRKTTTRLRGCSAPGPPRFRPPASRPNRQRGAVPLSWQRHSDTGAAARAEAVVARSGSPRLDVGDCDSAPSLLDRRFLASTITSCVGIDRTKGRPGRDHRGIARPGEAVISSLPALALLQLVRLGSDAAVEAVGCSATRATARRACKPPRIGPRASTSATPAAATKRDCRPIPPRIRRPAARRCALVARSGEATGRAAESCSCDVACLPSCRTDATLLTCCRGCSQLLPAASRSCL